MLDGDLGQQQAAASMLADQETVASDFDGFGKNRLRRRENAELDFEMRRFVLGDRRKTVIVEGGSTGGLRHGAIDRRSRQGIADTATQLATKVERSESAAEFGEVRSGRIQRKIAVLQRGGNRLVRQS